MKIEKLLKITGIARGTTDKEHQYYQFVLEDSEGKYYAASIGCKRNYIDSIEKTFNKIFFIPLPKPKDIEPEGDVTNVSKIELVKG